MSEMKCPFCQQELEKYYWGDLECYACPDLTCEGYYMTATKDMWQELIKVMEEKQHKNTATDQQDEVWKDVVGYEGLYRISNKGIVCRLYKNGKVNFMTPRILNGYWRVKLCNGNTQKEYFLHRLIAQAFIPNPENKPEINHINGIKTDNRIENLEWVTRSENAIHATKTGLLKYSEYRYNRARDINSKPVMCVETRKIYVSCTEAGKDIKTDAAHIGECISGKRSTAGGYHWKLVSIIDAYNSTRKELEQSEICCTEWEKQALDYKAENIALSGELERTRKALDYAIDVIQTVAKMSDKLSREYGETLVEQLDNIQAYCWQEGYVLTHEEDLSKALEQKDVK